MGGGGGSVWEDGSLGRVVMNSDCLKAIWEGGRDEVIIDPQNSIWNGGGCLVLIWKRFAGRVLGIIMIGWKGGHTLKVLFGGGGGREGFYLGGWKGWGYSTSEGVHIFYCARDNGGGMRAIYHPPPGVTGHLRRIVPLQTRNGPSTYTGRQCNTCSSLFEPVFVDVHVYSPPRCLPSVIHSVFF